ncbi:MAG: antibiotic biosynthesis monooxygenase [Opitutales bacterium]|nr:antibiotic biosynthesis monooxygenase [Opitutales bacterium]NRA28139.1 antibiotic biosynthesis monooxygenase [Opitutales bacterium]
MAPDKECFAVIFTSERTEVVDVDYSATADRMIELAEKQDGFIGVDSVRGQDGKGITVSYWETEESIRIWKRNMEHLGAQELGKKQWYTQYSVRIAKVVRAYESG